MLAVTRGIWTRQAQPDAEFVRRDEPGQIRTKRQLRTRGRGADEAHWVHSVICVFLPLILAITSAPASCSST